MTKSKRQGTAWESAVVDTLKAAGWDASRLAEGGIRDVGDIYATDPYGHQWVIEAKHRERLNPHRALAAAKAKVAASEFADCRVAVWWKRTVLKDGNSRRTADGEPVVVVCDPATFLFPEGS